MTRAQQIHLMTLWRRACDAQGWDPNDSDRRHAIYSRVLGCEKRFSQFDNHDFDRVKAALLFLDDQVKGAIESDHPEIGRMRRLRWKCRKFPEAYAASIARDKFGTDDLESLDEVQLTHLLMTLTARSAKGKKAAKNPF